ncbi:glyceraldehyde 3-phosphate dehydrogenase NAD-binding domain-containing protein, partial [Helicobacter pylori]
MKIFINGFGRIGRCVLRAILERSDTNPNLEVIG